MRDREPTIRSRALGEGLRRAVDKAGLNGVQVAHELGWSTSKVSRLPSGKRGGDEVEVSALLAVCRVKGKERSRLLAGCSRSARSSTPRAGSSSTAPGYPRGPHADRP